MMFSMLLLLDVFKNLIDYRQKYGFAVGDDRYKKNPGEYRPTTSTSVVKTCKIRTIFLY